MSIKVMDGARTLAGATATADIPIANYANANTMNSTGVDMKDHFELLVALIGGVVTGTAVVTLYAQESNEAAANFTNIASATATLTAAAESNLSKWISVNWKHPDRKRYARVSGVVSVANAAFYGALTLRVGPHGGAVTADGALTEA